ncbi:peptidoglycan-binding domain-containing protein [Actinopolyspora alba]|uniref:peptidoglycan-binding domain-containing protein n=1 Tax=Actinopolyspora alba TaxID=673379 RepID=UPI001C3129C6|nr:peptidoglycan-binding domain-containing protein [Actinopolyspora alba]
MGALAIVLMASPVLLGSAAAADGADRADVLALPTCTTGEWWIPATASGDSDCILARGNANDAVRHLQRSLRDCNGQNIAVDGIYGPGTEAAVMNVQRSAGIAVDGVYGPNTRDVMSHSIHFNCSE